MFERAWKRAQQLLAGSPEANGEENDPGDEGRATSSLVKALVVTSIAGFAAGAGVYFYIEPPSEAFRSVLPLERGRSGQMQRWRRLWKSGHGESKAALGAGYRLSRSLIRSGRPEKALKIARSLRNCSAPGKRLWKASHLLALRAARKLGRHRVFLSNAYRLLANAGRYDDSSLSTRVLYRLAMLRLQRALERSKRLPVEPAGFGTVEFPLPDLDSAHIGGPSRRIDEEGPLVSRTKGGLAVRCDGVPLSGVMEKLAAAGGRDVRCGKWADRAVFARMKGYSARLAQRVIAGSVGAALPDESGRTRLEPVKTLISGGEALDGLALELQRLIILGNREEIVTEAHYALARAYAEQGETDAALTQLDLLCRERPGNRWADRAFYLAGRLCARSGRWKAAAQEFAGVPAPRGTATGYRSAARAWRGICEGRAGRHGKAVRLLRGALELKQPRELRPRVLYALAYNAEKDPETDLRRARNRYRELRTRYPECPGAARGLFRLARIAVKSGRPKKAASLVKKCFAGKTRKVVQPEKLLKTLLNAVSRTGRPVETAVVARILAARSEVPAGVREEALEACRRAGMPGWGLEVLDCLAAGEPAPAEKLQRVRFLAAAGRPEDALAGLRSVERSAEKPETAQRARLQKADIFLDGGRPRMALKLCRPLAWRGYDRRLCRRALGLVGRCYMKLGDPDRAVMAYEGRLPMPGAEGDVP